MKCVLAEDQVRLLGSLYGHEVQLDFVDVVGHQGTTLASILRSLGGRWIGANRGPGCGGMTDGFRG